MTQTEKQSWEQVRAKGRSQYVLREGLLRRGLPFGIMMTIFMLLVDYFSHSPIEPVWKLAVRFAFYTLAFGLLMGSTSWSNHEKDFQKPTDDHVV
jgi:hypothetical protein